MEIGYLCKIDKVNRIGLLCYIGMNEAHYLPFKVEIPVLSDINERCLVYYEKDGMGKIFSIERASLRNFRSELLKDIWPIVDPNALDYQGNFLKYSIDCSRFKPRTMRSITDSNYVLENSSIEDAYNFFDDDYFSNVEVVDVLDLSYWVKAEDLGDGHFFGTNVEEISILFELFEKKYNTEKAKYTFRADYANFYYLKKKKSEVSKYWSLILKKISIDELDKVFCKYPSLQPAFPEYYLNCNLNNLSETYGFPTTKFCLKFYENKITQFSDLTEFLRLKRKIENSKNMAPRDRRIWNWVHLWNLNDDDLSSINKFLKEQYEKFEQEKVNGQ